MGCGDSLDCVREKVARVVVSVSKPDQEYLSLFNHIRTGVLLLDREKHLLFANHSFLAAAGLTLEESQGHSWESLFPYLATGRFSTAIDQAIEIGLASFLTSKLNKTLFAFTSDAGQELHQRISVERFRLNEDDFGCLIQVEDETPNWEREVLLTKLRHESEMANRAKSDFLASMSHELRTPLTSIIGFSRLLGMDPVHPLSPEQKVSVEHILRGTDHLLNLINEVLDLAKIESGDMNIVIEQFDPREAIETSLKMIGAMAEKYNISVVNDSLGWGQGDFGLVLADPGRFRQVLLNFLSNAVKYNREGGTVTFSVSCVSQGLVRFAVTDTGKGIPEDKHEELFLPFKRLGEESGTIEGSGIGLTIAKQLAEMMGGQIGFSSTLGEGSTFWVDVPKATGREEIVSKVQNRDAVPEIIENETETVLFIDDNPGIIKLMEMIFHHMPTVQLKSADTAELGLALAEQNQPDLILMDINLPGMSGVEALKVILKSDTLCDTPVIAVSANAMPSDIQSGLDAGFVDYITKPFDPDEVIRIATKYLAKSRKGRVN